MGHCYGLDIFGICLVIVPIILYKANTRVASVQAFHSSAVLDKYISFHGD